MLSKKLFLLLIGGILFSVAFSPQVVLAENTSDQNVKCFVKGKIQDAMLQAYEAGNRYLLVVDIKEMKNCEGKYAPSVMGIYLNSNRIGSGGTDKIGEEVEGTFAKTNGELVFQDFYLTQKPTVTSTPGTSVIPGILIEDAFGRTTSIYEN